MSYLRLIPQPDAVIPTKEIAPPQWPQPDEHGVWPAGAGRFQILAYTRPEYVKTATDLATKQVVEAGKPTRREVDEAILVREVFAACLKGWANLIDPDTDRPLDFTPANVARLPKDAVDWLWEEIMRAGNGILSTRDVITRDEVTGQPLDDKSPAAQVPDGDAPAV